MSRKNWIVRTAVAAVLLLAGAAARGPAADDNPLREKALQLKSNYAGAHYNLGMIMLHQRDFAKAQEQFSWALQTLPLDPMIWNALGVAQVSLGRTEEAIANYQHALKLNPNFAEALTDLGSAFLTQGKYAEAIQMSEKAVRLKPGVAQTREILGAALLNLGHTDDSIPHNRIAIALNPDLTLARVNLAMALMAKGNYDEAISHLEYVLRLIPQDEVAQNLLIEAQRKRNAAATQP